MRHETRLTVTVILLIVAGVVVRCMFSLRYPPSRQLPIICGYLGLLIAQAMLLGLWGGFSRSPLGLRVCGVVIGMLFLWSEMTLEVWNQMDFEPFIGIWSVFAIPMAAILIGATVVKHSKARLYRYYYHKFPSVSDTLQFGIRHMLVATTVSAALMMGAMAMKRFFVFAGYNDRLAVIVVFALVLAFAYPLTALVSLWAALGLNRPWPRLFVVAAVALATALFPLVIVPFDREGGTMFISSSLLQAALVVAVLLVARSSGYRLVPLRLLIEQALVRENPCDAANEDSRC